MPRPRTLTDEQRIENKKKLDSHVITINVQKHFRDKIDDFSKQYTSRNKAIIDLIKTHPDFKKFDAKRSRVFNQI